MAKLQTVAQVDKSPEHVAELLCSEAFLVAIEKQREEVVDAVYRLIEQTDDMTVFEIAVTGYKHNKKGDLDKSGTNTNIAEYRWERAKQTLSVQYKGSGRILIEASYRMKPETAGTRLSYEATIDVKIPVVGTLVANRIKKEMQRSFDTIISKIAG
jgi:ribosome-associated translation inhibitor RaiA